MTALSRWGWAAGLCLAAHMNIAAAAPQNPANQSYGPAQIVRASTVPTLPESRPGGTSQLTGPERELFQQAYQAMNAGNWPRALNLASEIKNPTARKLVRWAYLIDEQSDPSFEEFVSFLDQMAGWPSQNRILIKAEEKIPASMPASRVIAWFGGQEPMTGEGMIRLGEALIETGEAKYGSAWIARAWAEKDFPDSRQSEIWAAYSRYLSGDPTIQRMNRLLWSAQSSQAEFLRPHVPSDLQKIAGARIQLIRGAGGADTAVLNLPANLRTDPGIIFDLVRFYRRQGQDDAAQRLLISEGKLGVIPYADKVWIERNAQARNLFEERRFKDAYEIVSHHGMVEGSNYADAEWLSGWIALRFLNKPRLAVAHFEAMLKAVTFPISVARGNYWIGRAAEAAGETDRAIASYQAAAAHPFTYYGQLAAENPLISASMLTLPVTMPPDAEKWRGFVELEQVRAIRMLKDVDGEQYMRLLAFDMADNATEAETLTHLAELMRQLDKQSISVRIAKKASQKQFLISDYLYPLMTLPGYVGIGRPPEPALILGLTRQESEFNPRAVSSAGARGLMQLMPATAKLTANKHGLPYKPEALLDDPVYNIQIGMAHFGDLLERFDGSYILSIAAYNAGPGRSVEWVTKFGDPRTKGVDAIDWIELIPFNETRNYVQRVLENTMVYRHRIAGKPVKFATTTDLKRTTATEIDLSYVTASAPSSAGESKTAPPTAPEQAGVPAQAEQAPKPQPEKNLAQAETPVPQPTAKSQTGENGASPQPQDADLPPSGANKPGADRSGNVQKTWKIPLDCKRFIVHPDGTGECIER